MVLSSNISSGRIFGLLAFPLGGEGGRAAFITGLRGHPTHCSLCFPLRAAFKCWCQALDDIFRKPDALHTWKEFGTTPLRSATNSCSPPDFKDYSEEFLSKLGIWGCLQGAVIAAKIAQWVWAWDGSCAGHAHLRLLGGHAHLQGNAIPCRDIFTYDCPLLPWHFCPQEMSPTWAQTFSFSIHASSRVSGVELAFSSAYIMNGCRESLVWGRRIANMQAGYPGQVWEHPRNPASSGGYLSSEIQHPRVKTFWGDSHNPPD